LPTDHKCTLARKHRILLSEESFRKNGYLQSILLHANKHDWANETSCRFTKGVIDE
jgi:hypothetical protein